MYDDMERIRIEVFLPIVAKRGFRPQNAAPKEPRAPVRDVLAYSQQLVATPVRIRVGSGKSLSCTRVSVGAYNPRVFPSCASGLRVAYVAYGCVHPGGLCIECALGQRIGACAFLKKSIVTKTLGIPRTFDADLRTEAGNTGAGNLGTQISLFIACEASRGDQYNLIHLLINHSKLSRAYASRR